MREIQFRGKLKDNGEWVYGFIAITEMYPYDGKNQGAYIWEIPCVHNCIPVIPDTVGQYTGIKDKNGVKIFEGDIISGGEGCVPTQIIWDEKDCAYYAYNLRRKEHVRFGRHFKIFIGGVIGNIHDNPDLLRTGAHERDTGK